MLFVLAGITAAAQVDGIKGASKANRSSGGSESKGGSVSAGMLYFFGDLLFRGTYLAQTNVLQRRGEVPNVLSLEVFGQTAVQPSSYYIFNPRVRGNWGIFLSDFRVNYMLEETVTGRASLRTNDWQVLGINIINRKQVTARVSTGVMAEIFEEGSTHNESVFGLSIMSKNQLIGGTGEFRIATDYNTGMNSRIEVSAGVQRRLFERSVMHVFAIGGVMFQRYYNEIDVWGFQGGLAFKLY